MGSEALPGQEKEFVFRRLSEALRFGGKEVDGYFWLAIIIPILILGFIYVVWMYVRDSRSVGWRWATFLGALRSLVYIILALVFLLPGIQTWDRIETRSKVVLLIDVSGSMQNSKDELPTEAMPVEKLLTRQDKLIRFLTDDQLAFLQRLVDQNPITMYRFGGQVDDEFQLFEGKKEWAEEQWSKEKWIAWLKPDPKVDIPAELDDAQRAEFIKKRELLAILVNSTNLGDSLLAVLNRESNNMVQGIIVVSDGRSNQFSTQTFEEIKLRAQKQQAKIPIFTVGVGEHRQPINIRITDVQAPEQAQPDNAFPVRVDVDGEGLAGQPVDITLELTDPTGKKITLKPKDMKPGELAAFKPGEPPHVQVEFQIDKPEIEGDWKIVARVPKDRREPFIPKDHVSDVSTVSVIKKPLRVLLFAGAPNRDYQFLRALLVREVDRKRAELSICIQNARPEVVQDVPGERMLAKFPRFFRVTDDPSEKAEEKYDNLGQYDVIVGFDPDWTMLSPEAKSNLERWVEKGGGLIVVGGPVNTFQLTRGVNYEQVKPILDLYPVVLEDSRKPGVDRSATDPWRLTFVKATKDMEFLNLEDESTETFPGWEEYYTGKSKSEGGGGAGQPLLRGFYNYYPVKNIKPNASTILSFSDPRARLADGQEQPFLVSMPYKGGKSVYLSSGEIWRLRQFRESYHERFWTKLLRYAGSADQPKMKARGTIFVSRLFTANQFARITASLLDREMKPLSRTEKPRLRIKPPDGVKMTTTVDMQPNPGKDNDWSGLFAARFLLPAPGNYELELPVPGSTDTLTAKFSVKEANPELDNTRPDFDQLRQIASPAAEVLLRVKEDDKRDRIKAELERTNRPQSKETTMTAATLTDDKEGPRLFFDLKSAEVIPDCMKTDIRTRKSLGAVHDLWDDGFVVKEGDPPWKISWVLLGIVTLLSIEWLTRKLLKLA